MPVSNLGVDLDCDNCWKSYHYRGGGNPLTDLSIPDKEGWLITYDRKDDPRLVLCPECWRMVAESYSTHPARRGR